MTETGTRRLTTLRGGRRAFHMACARVWLYAAIQQRRFSLALDRIGNPSTVRWDPFEGVIELRGRRFAAEQVGSFDGETWYWSWANPYLHIPEEKISIARSLTREASRLKIPALATPSISEADERMPLMIGDLTVAYSKAEAYYVANRSQVYALLPGQWAPEFSLTPLAQLQQSLEERHRAPLIFAPSDAIEFAAERLELTFDSNANEFILTETNGDVLHLPRSKNGQLMQRVGLCFALEHVTLEMVREHLANEVAMRAYEISIAGPSEISVTGAGFAIRIARIVHPPSIAREKSLMGLHEIHVRDFSALFTIDCSINDDYAGTQLGVFRPSLLSTTGSVWAPSQVNEAAGEPSPFSIPSEALAIGEILGRLEGAVLYDTVLQRPYRRRQ